MVLPHSEEKFELSRFHAETSKGGDARKAKPASLALKTWAGEKGIQIIVQPGVKPIQTLTSLDLWTIHFQFLQLYHKVLP